LPDSQKKKLIGLLTQPDPAKQAEQQAVIDNKNADTEHKHAQAGHAQALTNKDNAQAAKTVLDAAHAHADRRIQTLHGGLGPDHFIPQAASLPPGAALPQEPPPLEQMGTQQ
jgi:Tfp pilus assembly major pilin PilA